MRHNPLNRFRNTPPPAPSKPSHIRDLVGAKLTRSYQIDPAKIDEANRTIELAFSSEAEVERWFDEIEVLDHSAGAVDLSRLNSGANLLFNHNPGDPLGVVEQARIDSDRKGRAVVRFGESTRAEEFWKDVKAGILRNVSVGYRIHAYAMKEKRENGQHVYLVTRWEPFEVSIVTIPADTSVGVQRQAHNPTNPTNPPSQFRSIMNRQQIIAGLRSLGVQFDENATDEALADLLSRSFPTNPTPAPAPTPSVTVTREAPVRTETQERERVRQIMEIGNTYRHRDLADTAIANGDTVDQFRTALLEEVGKQRGAMADSHKGIGLSKTEVRQFSLVRLINAISDPTNKSFARAAAYELEVVAAASAASKGREIRGVLIPADITECDLYGQRCDFYGRRDIISVGGGAGYTANAGNLVSTNLLTSSFVEMLRNNAVLLDRCTVLTGLEGDVDIPKQIGQAAAGWVGEDADAPGTDVEFGLIGMSPKTVAAYAQLTRKTLKQSSLGVEGLVRMDLAKAAAQTIDKAGFYGDGTGNQPIGIAHVAGIGSVDFAAANPTYAEIVEMETALGEANINADTARYVGRAAFRGHAKTTLKFPDGQGGTIWEPGNTVNGYGTDITNQINAGDLFFGDFYELVAGLWGGLDVLVDPFTDSRKARLNLAVFQDVDFAVRRALAFVLGRLPEGP